MDPIQSIVTACAAMVLLVAVVAAKMVADRSREMRMRRIHPQQVATSRTAAQHYEAVQAADNYRNLFELPVMFYVAVLTLYVTQLVILPQLVLAWIYVTARYTHSYIHCTSNVVMRRFYAFLVSCLTLLAMWIVLAIQLLTKA